MRVGVDATSWDNMRGYGRFARNVVERLVALNPGTTYVMVSPPAGGPALPTGSRVLRGRGRLGTPRAATSSRPPHELALLSRLVRRADLDVMLFPSVYTWFPTPGVPTVVGVHDTIAHSLPGATLPGRRARLLWGLKERWAVSSSTQLFTVSSAARIDLTRRWGLPPERIAVVPEAPAAAFAPMPRAEAGDHVRALGVDPEQDFIVFAGGISPHKGLDVLLDALRDLLRRGVSVPLLVAVGDLEDERFESAAAGVLATAREPELRDRVLFPGFVSDVALAALFSIATVVVIPSLAEGFGLPAVEAAACGAALLLSDLPAHRETMDRAAAFVRPGDPLALAAELERLLLDPALRCDLGARAQVAVAGLSWEAGARVLGDVLAGAIRAP